MCTIQKDRKERKRPKVGETMLMSFSTIGAIFNSLLWTLTYNRPRRGTRSSCPPHAECGKAIKGQEKRAVCGPPLCLSPSWKSLHDEKSQFSRTGSQREVGKGGLWNLGGIKQRRTIRQQLRCPSLRSCRKRRQRCRERNQRANTWRRTLETGLSHPCHAPLLTISGLNSECEALEKVWELE